MTDIAEVKVEEVTVGLLKPHSSNVVSTTKYSILTFLPRFIFEQFQNLVNVFFLGIAIIQLFPELSPLGQHGTMAPLVFILLISAIKELYEDIRRFVSDRQINNRLVRAFSPKLGWKEELWHNLKVGQIVKVDRDEDIPADLVLLSSSEPAGMAYIETANLDGESNLKIRQALTITALMVTDQSMEELARTNSTIRCDAPNCLIYDFNGVLDFHKTPEATATNVTSEAAHTQTVSYSLSNGHLIPRGARLKNTDWIYGVIVYAGKNTKLMKNSTRTPTKRAYVDMMTNYIMTMQFGILLILCVVAGLLEIYFVYEYRKAAWYLGYSQNVEDDRKSLIACILGQISLLNGIMPISLYVTLEFIRLVQARFIENDIEMYDEKSDTRALVRRSNLNETLGQIRYLLSDKTGTLTENKMIFKMCSIAGRKYGDKDSDGFDSKLLIRDLNSRGNRHVGITQFLTLLSVCHTVVPEKTTNALGTELSYHASSPDEAALVKSARLLGFVFHTRTPEYVLVDVRKRTLRFDVLSVLEFTSDRKRMGVVIRTHDRKIRLYVKGADSTILPRLSPECDRTVVMATLNHLRHFANLGYRTLCLASRELTEEEYIKWEPGYYAACTALDNRRAKVDAQAELIEKDLTLIGVTAIEDKLQVGVPETIQRLNDSDIRVWILTGDKLETAINIGHSSSLIKPSMPAFVLTPKTPSESTTEMVRRIVVEVEAAKAEKTAALVIDGETLQRLIDEGITYEFVYLAINAACVICCRCTPRQKAAMVRLVRKHVNGATLAIGDGANDVAMIQAADVGVGISGEEGLQASLAADYSIAQFRFLQRLLFVHGTLSYTRTVKTIYFSFYKNVVEILLLLLYVYFTGFSDTPLMDPNAIVIYNLVFTSWAPLTLGAFDRPATTDMLVSNSKLYRLSQNRSTFSMKNHIFTLILSLVDSAIIFTVLTLFYQHETLWSDGKVGGVYTLGNIINFALVVFINCKALLEAHSISIINIWVCGCSIFWYLLFAYGNEVLYTPFPSLIEPDMIDALWILFTTPSVIFAILLAVGIPLLIFFLGIVIRRSIRVYKAKEDVALVGQDIENIFTPFSKIYKAMKRKKNIKRQPTSYAFSQEENGSVNQADLIRAYDSTRPKKAGTPLDSERSHRFSHIDPGSNSDCNVGTIESKDCQINSK